MMSDPNQLRNDIERTRHELGEDVDALADKVNPQKIAQRQSDKLRSRFSSVKDRVLGAAEETPSLGDAVADARRTAVEKSKGNPVAVGLIAFGVGWLVSSLIPASTAETKAAAKVKETVAPVVEDLKDTAKEAAEHLREPAQEAAQAVKSSATGAASTVKDEGAGAASDLKDKASAKPGRTTGQGDPGQEYLH